MGRKIIQRIHFCVVCGHEPEDGETMWQMHNGVWCDECADDVDEEGFKNEESE